ncbi:hypothetical protein HHK36_017334 [Tetracentron sinense]|uniref:Uncharacterized protein n=1 Tax=Tetracentron sinense TaxID=13715 RepID=A0A834Z7Y0_TETSI|nr:hypothetical protein HHK36_017334 [Tetracentron sinense]
MSSKFIKDLSVPRETRVKAISEICSESKFSDIIKNFLGIDVTAYLTGFHVQLEYAQLRNIHGCDLEDDPDCGLLSARNKRTFDDCSLPNIGFNSSTSFHSGDVPVLGWKFCTLHSYVPLFVWFSLLLISVASVLAENGRLCHIENIANRFVELTMAHKGDVKVAVTTVILGEMALVPVSVPSKVQWVFPLSLLDSMSSWNMRNLGTSMVEIWKMIPTANGRLRHIENIANRFVELTMAHKGDVKLAVTTVIASSLWSEDFVFQRAPLLHNAWCLLIMVVVLDNSEIFMYIFAAEGQPLPPVEERQLTETLQGIIGHGKKVKLEQKIDPTILGGLVVDFGQKVFDMSIRTRARQMERFLRDPINVDSF